jgi:3-isopropylmalate/(R)-2-methylmalate dehydratase small subunit
MLPIILDQKSVNELIQYSERKEAIEINLEKQEIKFGNNKIEFDIDLFKKKCLLEGLDDIALSLEKSKKISFYEENIRKNKPWIS